MTGRNDRRAYLARVIQLLDSDRGPEIRARAAAVLDKWEDVAGIDPRHAARWRKLLAQEPAAIEAAVMAEGDAAEELRHCMPFAGILSNRERSSLRAR
jgi:hypothetical protein